MTSALLLILLGSPGSRGVAPHDFAAPLDANEIYPYRTPEFNEFVNESFGSPKGSARFYKWMAQAVRKSKFSFPDEKNLALEPYLSYKYKQLAKFDDSAERAKVERSFAASLHKMVKLILPHFSLDHGYEFTNAYEHGQRQCFLQSVLITGLLQKGGVRAGVAMVNCNVQGQETNNKHAVCIARLADGTDLIVDASEDEPFAKQHGLFTFSTEGFRFVKPVYGQGQSITSYQSYDGHSAIDIKAIRPLTRSFLRSQFDYYRGERTLGGVMAKQKTSRGLQEAAKFLTRSIQENPQNPLSQYMLGRVLLYQGRREAAARSLDRAMALYQKEGWVPPDERTSQLQAHQMNRSAGDL